jgi:hypothetical protein
MAWGSRPADVEAAVLQAVPPDRRELVDVMIDDIADPPDHERSKPTDQMPQLK